jgi:hypothetical protein
MMFLKLQDKRWCEKAVHGRQFVINSKSPLKIANACFMLALGLLIPIPIQAQVATGTISGTVKDAKENVLPGARVVIQNEGTGISRTLDADSSGRYVAPSLPPGDYQVTATREGFETEIRKGIVLTVGSESVVDLALAVGSVTQTVEVTGAAPVLDSTSASLGSLMDETSMRNLPLNGRSYDQLALMQPGVILGQRGGVTGSPFTFGTASHFSVGGQRFESNYFLLDGTDVDDQGNGTPGGAAGTNLGVDTIQEFKIFTSAFSAEFGHSSGSVITAITRSGTNAIHGTAFEYFRNSVLDTRNYFDVISSVPPFRRNQFGGVLGGPIKKDKAFFFTGYEGLRQGQANTLIAIVPDAQARQGILPTGTVTVNPAVVPYLDLYPLPNGTDFGDGFAEYTSAPLVPTNENNFMGRLDYQITNKTNIFGRYTFDQDGVDAQQSIPDSYVDNSSRRQYTTLQANSVLSPRDLNNARFAFNRTWVDYNPFTSPAVPTSMDFVPGLPLGAITIGGSVIPGGETTITPLGPNIGVPPNDKYAFDVFEEGDDFSHIMRNHALKAGVDLQQVGYNYESFGQVDGAYNFSSYNTFLAGTPSGETVGTPLGAAALLNPRQWIIGIYGQDDYTVNSRLTLNLGLRWEATTDPTNTSAKMVQLPSPSATSVVTASNYFSVGKKNFDPRFGLEWRLNGKGTTVLRVGAGVYNNDILPWLYQNFLALPPFAGRDSLSNPPFPYGYTLVTSESGIGNGTQALQTIAPDMKTPVDYQYNLSIQQQIFKDTVIQIAYAGSRDNHLPLQFEEDTRVNEGTAANPYYPSGDAKVNPAWADVREVYAANNSIYNSGTVTLRRQSSGGVVGQISYTFAKALDIASSMNGSESTRDPQIVMNPYDPKQDWGLSEYNVKSAVVANFTYPLPIRVQSKMLGGIVNAWTFDGLATFETGLPFSALDASNASGDNDSQNADRPNLNAGFSNNPNHGVSAGCPGFAAGTRVGTATNWYDPCAFSLASAGHYGDLGRNTVIGPGYEDVDLALSKDFQLHEGVIATFKYESFNIANHADLGLPTTDALASSGAASPFAGLITYTTTNSRQSQFALRISF